MQELCEIDHYISRKHIFHRLVQAVVVAVLGDICHIRIAIYIQHLTYQQGSEKMIQEIGNAYVYHYPPQLEQLKYLFQQANPVPGVC